MIRKLGFTGACEIGRSAASMPGALDRPAVPAKPRGRAPLLTDAQILEMRALAEFAGWSQQALALRFNVDLSAVRRFLSYVTRSRLVPRREHLPVEVAA